MAQIHESSYRSLQLPPLAFQQHVWHASFTPVVWIYPPHRVPRRLSKPIAIGLTTTIVLGANCPTSRSISQLRRLRRTCRMDIH
jgi:hypothetical protein